MILFPSKKARRNTKFEGSTIITRFFSDFLFFLDFPNFWSRMTHHIESMLSCQKVLMSCNGTFTLSVHSYQLRPKAQQYFSFQIRVKVDHQAMLLCSLHWDVIIWVELQQNCLLVCFSHSEEQSYFRNLYTSSSIDYCSTSWFDGWYALHLPNFPHMAWVDPSALPAIFQHEFTTRLFINNHWWDCAPANWTPFTALKCFGNAIHSWGFAYSKVLFENRA